MADKLTLDDVILELRGAIREHLNKGSTCSWGWNPNTGAPFTISAVRTTTTPPDTVGVTISVNETHVTADYIGVAQPQYQFEIPRLSNGDYDLRWDVGPLPELCEPIATTLRRIRC